MTDDMGSGHTDVDSDRPTMSTETTPGDGVSAIRLTVYGIVTGSAALSIGRLVSSQVLPGDGPVASGLLVAVALGISVTAGLFSDQILGLLPRARHDRRHHH